MPIEMHPTAYHEHWGAKPPQNPTNSKRGGGGGNAPPPSVRSYKTFTLFAKKSVGADFVILNARVIATGGYVAWEPIQGRQLDILDTLIPSNPHYL